MKPGIGQLCGMLERLIDGSFSADDVRAKHGKISFEGLNELYGNLFHYLSGLVVFLWTFGL